MTLGQAQRRTISLAKQGFYCGLQTGGVVEVAVRSAIELQLEGDVLAISGDAGWKNTDNLAAL